jgi:phosphoglycerol transferase MdoB-like AlkP superfamily enzyme
LKHRVIFFFKYFAYWIIITLIFRLLFILYHLEKFQQVRFWDYILIFIHGLKLDISVVAYIVVFPALCFLFLSWVKNHLDYKIIKIYTIIVLIVFTLLHIIDLELYNYWHYRLDNTFLNYIDTPGEMLANLKWQHYFIIIAAIAVSYYLCCVIMFNRLYPDFKHKSVKRDWLSAPVFLIIIPSLIVIMRGGFGTAPLNVGSVYFHRETIVNHAAINPVWNLIYTLTEDKETNYHVEFFDKETESSLLDRLKVEEGKTKKVLTTSRPNIIIILLESFTTRIIEKDGGKAGAAPNLNSLINEGIYFDNFYATGCVSAHGIGAVLAGYPALPSSYILKFESKVEHIPGLCKDLNELGYTNRYFYGGDIDFAHVRSFLIHNRFDEIVSIKDFPASDRISSWGVPDHIVFKRLLEVTNNANSPFCHVLFTLSSHAPFDIPMEPVFKGNSKEAKFFNSVYYTDKAIGEFINNAKLQPWWDSTLIILVADHGARIEDISVDESRRFHIPMLMLGGALNVTDTIISKYGNQTDIPATLLSQMELNTDRYNFSRDLLSDDTLSYTYYTYHKGIGYLDDYSYLVYDLTYSQFIEEEGYTDKTRRNLVKAILQNIWDDYTNR